MHAHMIDYNERDGRDRGHWSNRGYTLWLNLPSNPACWLLGHRPRVVVVTPTTMAAYAYLDCRWCGRRHHDPERRLTAATAQARGAQIEANTDRRIGWGGCQAEFHAQVVLGHGQVHTAGLSVGLGGLGSETPIDVAAYVPLAGLYLHTSLGGRLAERLTGGTGSREFQVVFDGPRQEVGRCQLQVTPWGRKHETRQADPWWVRGKTFHLSPLDRLWGERRYTYAAEGDPVEAIVRMPDGDDHPVILQLLRQRYGRPRGGRQIYTWSAAWSSRAGIPFRRDGWKGDGVHGSSVAVSADAVRAGRWPQEAVARIAVRVAGDRARYDWKPATAEATTDGGTAQPQEPSRG
jgi:hypothetical protein